MSEEFLDMLDLSAIDTDTTTDRETPEVETGLETPEVEETDTDTDTETPEAETTAEKEESTDGRKVPDSVRKAIKSLKESGPEGVAAAKVLNETYGREQAYKQVFPDVATAKAAQASIQSFESHGGVEAAQQTLSEVENIDALLREGDPAVLDTLAEIAGEGFNKLAPAMLERLEKTDPTAYTAAIKPHLARAITGSGLQGALESVYEALETSRTPGATQEFREKFEQKATELLKKIYGWADKAGKDEPTAEPVKKDDKLTAREQAIATRENTAFTKEIETDLSPKMSASVKTATDPYFKNQLKALTPAARKDLIQGIYNEAAELVQADKVYQDQKNGLIRGKNRDSVKASQVMSAKFDSVVVQATKNVISRRYGKSAPTKAQAQAQGATDTKGAPAVVKGKGTIEKPVLVKELPDRKDVDLGKTTEALMMRGIRVLKNGSVIKLS